MEFMTFTKDFFGIGKTKQEALDSLLNRLEKNNTKPKSIKIFKMEKLDDHQVFMERGFYNAGKINLKKLS